MRFGKELTGGLLVFLAAAMISPASAQQSGGGVITGEAGKPAPAPAPAPVPAPAPAPGATPLLPRPVQSPTAGPSPEIDLGNLAKLPYEALIKIAQSDAKQPKDAEIYTLRISSKLNVAPSQIQLYLDRADAPQKLEIDQFGYFMVPYNQALVTENPDLVSNQPKGSLSLQVKLSLDKPDWPQPVDNRITYQALFDPVLKLSDSMRQVDPLFGDPDQQQFAVRMKMAPNSSVKIIRSYGARTLASDQLGHVWLVYEKLLHEENPQIVLPGPAEFEALPVTPEHALKIRTQ